MGCSTTQMIVESRRGSAQSAQGSVSVTFPQTEQSCTFALSSVMAEASRCESVSGERRRFSAEAGKTGQLGDERFEEGAGVLHAGGSVS